MRRLTAAELLEGWERGLAEPSPRRTLPLLAAAHDSSSIDEMARLSIGERDARLLQLREQIFGPALPAVSDCDRCGEHLEWTSRTSELHVTGAGDLAGREGPPDTTDLIEDGGYRLRFRLPTSMDLVAVAQADSVVTARRGLLEACVVTVERDGAPIAPVDLPEPVVERLATRIGERDPQADIQLSLTCPACGHAWDVPFDIEAFLWAELTAWAQRLLRDVHVLASAYGWRERDVLTLSPWRRQAYLGLVGA